MTYYEKSETTQVFTTCGLNTKFGSKYQNTPKNTDNLLNHLIESFSNIATTEFFDRLKGDTFEAYKLKFGIPDYLVQKLIRVHEN